MSPSEPVLGPLAKVAIRASIEGQKRRRVLVLLAAYADAGEDRPSLDMIAHRLPFLRDVDRTHPHRRLRHLLKALERDGWITIESRRRKSRTSGKKLGGRQTLYVLNLERAEQ